MSPKTRNLILFGLTSLVILLIVAFGLYIPYLKAYNLVHPGRGVFNRFPVNVGIRHSENVQFVTSDDITIKGWYVPPQNGAVVIFVHGLGGDRQELLDEAGFITTHGYGALLLDLRAHGESGGTVSTLGFYEPRDIRAAVDFVQQRAGANTLVALLGHSMGAGVVLLAAAQISEVAAVIAESPFTTLEDNISTGVSALTGLPPFPFAPLIVFFAQRETGVELHQVQPIDVIGQISPRPVLLIHGERDSVIPAENSNLLYEAAGEPKQLYILNGVGHGGFLQAQPKVYPAKILDFLDSVLRQP